MQAMLLRSLLVICLALAAGIGHSQEWRLSPLSPLDQRYIDGQIERIDELARRHLGRSLQGNSDNDIRILQTLLDQGRVKGTDTELLQAMGIVLGQLLKAQQSLQWVVYEDRLGRSRALQIPGINEFIFPATQISRRAEVGIAVSVAGVYQELEDAVTAIRNQPRSIR